MKDWHGHTLLLTRGVSTQFSSGCCYCPGSSMSVSSSLPIASVWRYDLLMREFVGLPLSFTSTLFWQYLLSFMTADRHNTSEEGEMFWFEFIFWKPFIRGGSVYRAPMGLPHLCKVTPPKPVIADMVRGRNFLSVCRAVVAKGTNQSGLVFLFCFVWGIHPLCRNRYGRISHRGNG